MSACTRSIAMMCYRRDACRRGNLKYVTSSHGKAPEISDAHEARCAAGRRRPAVPRIILTGTPGAGKTTLVCRIAAELQAIGLVVAGFTSRELRERSGRVGFQAEAIGGASRLPLVEQARADPIPWPFASAQSAPVACRSPVRELTRPLTLDA
jgi:hypothetical protein